jgi:hypothetical protein
MMRILDPRSSRWAIRHIYVIMAAVGIISLALVQPVGGYLSARNDVLFAKATFDDPNFVYLHEGGDADMVSMWLLVIGGWSCSHIGNSSNRLSVN